MISAIVIDYVSMGIGPRVVSIASTTLPGEMHFFTEDELSDLNINWDPGSFGGWEIEPYGSGVIAFSKTQDKKETATVFCRSDRTFRLLITAPIFSNAAQLGEAIDALGEEIQAMGLNLPKEAAKVRMVSGLPALEIQLTGLDLKSVSVAKTLLVEGSFPRVSASYFYHPLSAKNAAQCFRVVARNCL